LVAAPSRSPRDGRFIEILGHYNPLTNPASVVFKEERIIHWLKEGAQPSESVKRIFITAGIWQKFTGKPVVYPAPKAPKAAPETANA
jgi:small subunit ribosomal protein S16